MKKILLFIFNIFLCGLLLSGCSYNSTCLPSKIYDYNEVKDLLIRFHVLANSDSKEDQDLKIKVKNAIINSLYSDLSKSKSIDETRNILISKEAEIKELSEKIIKDEGYNYSVKIELKRENFPEKQYGSIILPQGNYEAFRVIIGNGNGHNWWCVMFPPLCFIDVTKGKVEDDESRQKLDDEILKDHKENKEDEIKIKFKVAEEIKKIFKNEN